MIPVADVVQSAGVLHLPPQLDVLQHNSDVIVGFYKFLQVDWPKYISLHAIPKGTNQVHDWIPEKGEVCVEESE